MRKEWLIKILALDIVILFIGAGVIPAISAGSENNIKKVLLASLKEIISIKISQNIFN